MFFGYCPYLLLVLVQKRSEIFADRSRDWHPGDSGVASQLRDWETAEGFWSQKKTNSFNKENHVVVEKTSCFLEVAVNFSRFVGCYELVASRSF